MNTITRMACAAVAVATAAMTGCASPGGPTAQPAPPGPMATQSSARGASVVMMSASGSLVSGKLSVMPMGDGLHLRGEIGGLAPGSSHAIHIHERGDCSAADASSAGGHFNPRQQPHGRAGHGAHHGGDMDNIVANGEGVATVDVHAAGVVLGGGLANDAAGRAVIVHAAADDYTTQPTGNAGARLACGIIKLTP